MARIAFLYGLASELVTLGSLRVDLRELSVLLEEMIAASNGVHDLASDEVQMAAEQVVESVGELFRQLPSLDKPMRRALAAWGGHDNAVSYQVAGSSQMRVWGPAACWPLQRWVRTGASLAG